MSASPATPDPEELLLHADYVRQLARHLVFDAELASDVEQQTWLAALEHAPCDARSPRAWLATLVRNFAFRAWRKETRRERVEHAAARVEARVPGPEEILEREQVRHLLIESVLALDEPYRSALVLRFFEELPPREVARRLGVPVETARTRIKRGLEQVRARLRHQPGRWHGDAWSLALVELLRLEAPLHRPPLAATARTILKGVVAMSATHKLTAVSLSLLALLGVLLVREHSQAARIRASGAGTPDREAALEGSHSVVSAGRAPARSSVVPEADHELAKLALGAKASLLVRVTWHDGSPASDIGLRALALGAPDSSHLQREARTAAGGTALFDGLEPGPVAVHPDRGGYGSTAVASGVRAELEIRLPRGMDVEGRTTEAGGDPVAGAAIFLHLGAGPLHEGFVVAHSDSDGRFAIRSVEHEVSSALCARASGRAPTAQHWLTGPSGGVVRVHLVFEDGGGRLRGRVLDDAGAPLAGAEVLVGEEKPGAMLALRNGARASSPTGELTRTDANGEFELHGVPRTLLPVQARARGFAPLWTEVDAAAQSWIELRLQRGATLRGRVTDEYGRGLEGELLRLAGGYDFGGVVVRSAADGSYEARDLPPGEIEAVAGGGARGTDRTSLFGASGAELRWDPRLDGKAVLLGRIETPGELRGWLVQACADSGAEPGYFNYAETDGNGRFQFHSVPDVDLRLTLIAPGPALVGVASLEHVRLGGGEVVIRPDPGAAASAWIRGRVVDGAGDLAVSAEIALEHPRQVMARTFHADPHTARFEIGPLTPGEWRVTVRAGEQSSSAKRTLAVDESWELGDLVLGSH